MWMKCEYCGSEWDTTGNIHGEEACRKFMRDEIAAWRKGVMDANAISQRYSTENTELRKKLAEAEASDKESIEMYRRCRDRAERKARWAAAWKEAAKIAERFYEHAATAVDEAYDMWDKDAALLTAALDNAEGLLLATWGLKKRADGTVYAYYRAGFSNDEEKRLIPILQNLGCEVKEAVDKTAA